MSIKARKTTSGIRYDVRLRDPAGEPYKRTFRTKREAETFQARERADRSRGAWVVLTLARPPRSASISRAGG
ncbi:MAG TPA: hypothetical protein VMZ51_01050 [Acidimicrobiales bacterium]|nr:hypothetical protein [Acidimicrobiales bacterium]